MATINDPYGLDVMTSIGNWDSTLWPTTTTGPTTDPSLIKRMQEYIKAQREEKSMNAIHGMAPLTDVQKVGVRIPRLKELAFCQLYVCGTQATLAMSCVHRSDLILVTTNYNHMFPDDEFVHKVHLAQGW